MHWIPFTLFYLLLTSKYTVFVLYRINLIYFIIKLLQFVIEIEVHHLAEFVAYLFCLLQIITIFIYWLALINCAVYFVALSLFQDVCFSKLCVVMVLQHLFALHAREIFDSFIWQGLWFLLVDLQCVSNLIVDQFVFLLLIYTVHDEISTLFLSLWQRTLLVFRCSILLSQCLFDFNATAAFNYNALISS